MNGSNGSEIKGLQLLQVHRARMIFESEKGRYRCRLGVIFYHLDGTLESCWFTRLREVQPLSGQPDSLWVEGESEGGNSVKRVVTCVSGVSSELISELIPKW